MKERDGIIKSLPRAEKQAHLIPLSRQGGNQYLTMWRWNFKWIHRISKATERCDLVERGRTTPETTRQNTSPVAVAWFHKYVILLQMFHVIPRVCGEREETQGVFCSKQLPRCQSCYLKQQQHWQGARSFSCFLLLGPSPPTCKSFTQQWKWDGFWYGNVSC